MSPKKPIEESKVDSIKQSEKSLEEQTVIPNEIPIVNPEPEAEKEKKPLWPKLNEPLKVGSWTLYKKAKLKQIEDIRCIRNQ